MALPETKGENIPDTLEEGEQGWNSNTFCVTCFCRFRFVAIRKIVLKIYEIYNRILTNRENCFLRGVCSALLGESAALKKMSKFKLSDKSTAETTPK